MFDGPYQDDEDDRWLSQSADWLGLRITDVNFVTVGDVEKKVHTLCLAYYITLLSYAPLQMCTVHELDECASVYPDKLYPEGTHTFMLDLYLLLSVSYTASHLDVLRNLSASEMSEEC